MTKQFRKFPQSNTEGFSYVFGDDDWTAMEADSVYGAPLPKNIRNLIGLATLIFTLHWDAEHSAPRLDGDTNKHIVRFTKLAEQLRRDLFHPNRSSIFPLVLGSPKNFLECELHKITNEHDDFETFLACLNTIIRVGDVILRKANSEDYGYREGLSWSIWVVLITLIMASNRLPTGIRSDPYRIRQNFTES